MADRYLSLQMNICRQCFREKSQDIGFNKVGFLFDYIRMASMSNLWDTKTDGVFFFQPTTVPLRYEPGTPLSPFFLFAFSRPIRLHDMYFPISRCSALGEAKKSTWEEKRIPN